MRYTFLILLLVPAYAQGQLTLERCYEQARQNYPLIKQHDLITKSAEFSISNANKAYLPQVSLTAIGGYIINGLPAAPGAESENGSFKFIGIGQINQTIWDGGATSAHKEIIRAEASVEDAQNDVSLYALRDRVNQLFFGVLVINEQLRQLDILGENLKRNINKVKQAIDNGLAYTSDADEVKVELIRIEQRKDEFKFTKKSYLLMLGLLIGEPLGESTILEKPQLVEGIVVQSIARPELTLYDYQRQLVQNQNAITRAAYMPKVGLLAFGVAIQPGAAFGAGTLSNLSIAGLNVSWNTAGLYRAKNNREQTKISLDRINNQQEVFMFNTNLQLAQQSTDVEKIRSILAKDDEIIALRKSIRSSYELKYQNGVCTATDLILAVNSEGEAASFKALHEIQLLLSISNYKTISGN